MRIFCLEMSSQDSEAKAKEVWRPKYYTAKTGAEAVRAALRLIAEIEESVKKSNQSLRLMNLCVSAIVARPIDDAGRNDSTVITVFEYATDGFYDIPQWKQKANQFILAMQEDGG